MFSLVGGSIHKTKIAYGCVLLLGSASVAGVAVGDSNGKWFSSLGGKIVEAFRGGGSGSAGSASDRENGLVVAWQWVSMAGQGVFNWAIKPTASAFTNIHKTYKNWWTGLKTLFGSLVTKEMYTMLFQNLHTKIYNILSFFLAGGSDRQKFINLFKTNQLSNTLKAGRILLSAEKIKGVNVEPNVFNFLLFKWLEDPKKVTGKFQRLSEKVDMISGNNWSGVGSSVSSSSSAESNNTYTLTTTKVNEYLEVDGESKEKIWLFFLYLQIRSKIKTGRSSDSWSSVLNFFTGGGTLA